MSTVARGIAVVLLLVGSVLSVINGVTLSHLTDQKPGLSLEARDQALLARINALAQQIPPPVAHTEPDSPAREALEALEARVAQLAQQGEVSAAERAALSERISKLEQIKPAPAPAPPPERAEVKPKVEPKAEPPFRVLAIEVRADERFVAISSHTATALAQVRLLRLGELEEGWRLESIEREGVVFSRAGFNVRLPIPGLSRP